MAQLSMASMVSDIKSAIFWAKLAKAYAVRLVLMQSPVGTVCNHASLLNSVCNNAVRGHDVFA